MTLDAYLSSPLAIPASLPLPQTDADVNAALARFLALGRTPLFQWRCLSGALAALDRAGTLKRTPLSLSPSLSPVAFMRDGGGITFSLGALLFRSSAVTLSVFCHEAAHVFLSRLPEYGEIKALDRAFRDAFAELPHVRLLSPIELFAMHHSLPLMDAALRAARAGRKTEKFRTFVQDERQKIASLTGEIRALRLK
jgi:hypothetical protein